MRRGFTVLELLLGLLLLNVGVLAVAGMLFLAQENLRRAELTLRGLSETGWIEDSLAAAGGMVGGSSQFTWGEVVWAPSAILSGGWDLAAIASVGGDTVVFVPGLPALTAEPLTGRCGIGGPIRVRAP